ncbi:hypothetical protein [Acinetobacter ursingii]
MLDQNIKTQLKAYLERLETSLIWESASARVAALLSIMSSTLM